MQYTRCFVVFGTRNYSIKVHHTGKKNNVPTLYFHLKDDDLLLKFFKAQLREPTKNDWCSQVKQDLDELNIEDDFDNIKQMTKSQMSNLVKEAYKAKAFDDLLEKQLTYSKRGKLVYVELN